VVTQLVDKMLTGPLLAWREDDPTLLPHCARCGCDIKIGDKYYIPRGTNYVACRSCTEASLGSMRRK
jgi:hypothetical protein